MLIDGRAVYSPLYGGVLWNVQDTLLEDVDRIEVISGPGGTLWGANAVNGVINITTKSSKDTQGVFAQAGGGTQLEDFAAFRYGGAIAPDIYYRVYGQYSFNGSEEFSDGSSTNNSIGMTRGGFRIDSYAVPQTTMTLQGDIYSGTEELGPTLGESGLRGGDILGRWTREFGDDSEASLQVYYDNASPWRSPSPRAPASPPFVLGFPLASLTDNLDTLDVELPGQPVPLGGRQNVVWGLGYRNTREEDQDLSIVRFSPEGLVQELYSAFVQYEAELSPTVHLTLGSKVEHNDYTGYEYEPSGRIRWNFTPKQMIWTAVSRAVRTPSRYDRDLQVVTGLVNAPAPFVFPATFLAGSPNFNSESVVAYELGYRAELGPRFTLSVSAYYNNYSDIRGTAATPTTATYPFPFPIVFGNGEEGDTYGLEANANFQVTDWWQLHAGYNLIREDIHAKPGFVDATGSLNETADPENQVFLRSSMDLRHGVEFDTALRWIDSLIISNGPNGGPVAGSVPSYFELNARLAWHVSRRLELSVVGQNLLHDHHPEYGYPGAGREEISRSTSLENWNGDT